MKLKSLMTLGLAATIWAGGQAAQAQITLNPIGNYETGIFDGSAAEIAAYDPASKRLFVTNAEAKTIDILDLSNPSKPTLITSLELPNGANSVAFHDGILAAAVEGNTPQMPGQVIFFDAMGKQLNAVTVGALPDMLTFTPDGQKVVVANEGEPNEDYSEDPEGSVSIIDLSQGIAQATVKTADFRAFNGRELDDSVRIFGLNASVAQDLEPEYVAVAKDSKTAWVTLQENNALAVVDLDAAQVVDIVGLGFKDHGLAENALDPSNKDKDIRIKPYANLFGVYQPDAIAAYEVNGETFLITSNEGDSRVRPTGDDEIPGVEEGDIFNEESRIGKLDLDPTVFPDAAALQDEAVLGRLKVMNNMGDIDGDGDYDALYAFGARSFSIWNSAGELVFDSGKDLEMRTAAVYPDDFNSTNDENGSFDDRSDDKGPEPEGVTVGQIGDRHYAFIGLERVGGVMVYDVTNPVAPSFVTYANARDFAGDAEAGTAGDLGPEGLLFIPATDSPNGENLLVVTNEVSGSTSIFQIMGE